MPIPSQPGLPYLIRDTRYSKDATDVIISFPVSQGSVVTFSFQFSPSVPLPAFSMSMPLNHRSVTGLTIVLYTFPFVIGTTAGPQKTYHIINFSLTVKPPSKFREHFENFVIDQQDCT